MLRNVPVGAGRRKNKPIQTRSQDMGNQPGEPAQVSQGPTATSTYHTPGPVPTDYPSGMGPRGSGYPPEAPGPHHYGGSTPLPAHRHDGVGHGVPAGTMTAMTGSVAPSLPPSAHGSNAHRYPPQEQGLPYHRCSQDPHSSVHSHSAGPGRCPSCSQYLHTGTAGEDSSRRVRPRIDDPSAAPASHPAGQGLLPEQQHMQPQAQLPSSPSQHAPHHHHHHQAGMLPGAPSGLPLGALPTGPHPMLSPGAAAAAAAGLPAHQHPQQQLMYAGMGGATPYPHDPSPAHSQPSLAGTLVSHPSFRAPGAPPGPIGGLGMGMGMGGLASQVPGGPMGYPGMGGPGVPGGAGMQQAAGMARGGWMSLAAVAGQHQEAVQRAAAAQQQLAAAQQQLQRVANFQAQQQLMQSSASHQVGQFPFYPLPPPPPPKIPSVPTPPGAGSISAQAASTPLCEDNEGIPTC